MMVKVRLSLLIMICNNLDAYNTFKKNFNEFITYIDGNNRDETMFETLSFLQTLAEGNNLFSIGKKRKIKGFYNENKEVIDKLNKINCEGLIKDYNLFASFIKETLIYRKKEYQPLCEYINRNKEKKEKILAVLNRLQELGFEDIKFDESADFTQKVYETKYKEIARPINRTIMYCENMEYILSYGDIIKYRTAKSNYRIKNDTHYIGPRIELNNLTFDPSSLPESIEYNYLYNKILAIVNEQEHISYTSVINSGLALNDIEKELENIKNKIDMINLLVNKLQSLEEREKLKEALLYMNLEIARMKQIETQSKKDFFSENPQISEEVLKKENDELFIRNHATLFLDYKDYN